MGPPWEVVKCYSVLKSAADQLGERFQNGGFIGHE